MALGVRDFVSCTRLDGACIAAGKSISMPCAHGRLGVENMPAWMEENSVTDIDRAVLETVRKLGIAPVEVPYLIGLTTHFN